MARNTKEIIIADAGRDQGKRFLLMEMPARPAEKWATRAFLALARSGVDIPEDIANSGWAGIAIQSLKTIAGVQFAEAEPLMDEMFKCIQFVPDTGIPRPLIDTGTDGDDIEEIMTRMKLRWEVVTLHTQNFTSVFLSIWESLRRLQGLQSTVTSPEPLAP